MIGLLWGIMVGAGVGWVAVHQLSLVSLQGPMAYLLAAAASALVGLVAGKPIWARGAAVEAGLKMVFGALFGAALLFGLQRWVPFVVDLSRFGLGQGPANANPMLALPAITTALAVLLEFDNLIGAGSSNKRIEAASSRARIEAGEHDVEAQDSEQQHKARGRR